MGFCGDLIYLEASHALKMMGDSVFEEGRDHQRLRIGIHGCLKFDGVRC